jgi:hypothetical protein
MKMTITAVHQRGNGLVWAIQLPHTIIFTQQGTLEAAEKKMEILKKRQA